MISRKGHPFFIAILSFIILAFSQELYAVPAAPIVKTLTQPDGTTFRARHWGDEWFNGWQTEEGYTIVFDEVRKSWTYGKLDIRGRLVSSFKRVGIDKPPPGISKHIVPENNNASLMQQQMISSELSLEAPQEAPPLVGTGHIPVILITFSDRTPTYTTTDINTLLFGSGNYSMKDYYSEVSYGQFTIDSGPGGVVGWYTASQTHDYYGANGSWGNQRWPGTLVREAVAAADGAGFNFAPYDQDGDGYVDVVAIIHQGTGEEEGSSPTDIWSHQWDLNNAYSSGYSNGGEYLTNDSVKVNRYIIMPEILLGDMETVGVFAHEYGHVLGLPDLYDTDDSSEGIGKWSLMASGSWNKVLRDGDRPAYLDAWSKYKLGWITPTLVSGTLINEPISQVETSGEIYQLLNGSPSTGGEYFLVENRQKVSFDEGLPGAGLLIWHIDESISNNKNECYPGGPSCTTRHYKVALMQADNLWELEKNSNRGNGGDPYPGDTNNTAFTITSSPNSNLWYGAASNVSITDISASGSEMTATLSTDGVPVTTTTTTVSSTTTTTVAPPTTTSAGGTTTTSADSTTTTSLCMIDGDCPTGQGCDNGVCKTQHLLTVLIKGTNGEDGLGIVTATPEGGSPIGFNTSEGSAHFFDGTQVALYAVPTPGADNNPVFYGWWGNDVPKSDWPKNPITITMNKDKTVYAYFINDVSITTTTSANSTTTTSIQPTTSSSSSSSSSSSTTTIPDATILLLVHVYYLDILDRESEPGGAEGWANEIERIMSLGINVGEGFQALARFFFNCQEYMDKNKNNTEFVTDLYQTFLQREPDSGGLTYWVGQLNQGLTRNMLITSFAYCDEFKAYMANLFGPDTSRPENNLLNDFYRRFLNRFPDNGGYNSWLVLIREAQCTGPNTLQDLCHAISLSFLESNEYVLRSRNNAEYTEDLYNAILRRGADPAGFQAWVTNLNNGMTRQQTLQFFTDSTEFQGGVDAVIAAGCLP